ncbi:hypothetical protein L9F63_002699 [Diploptera punctata]|uniref:Glucose-methanol-choline oxidoreductase C-terminal domain-containing protein n=1 Tax=Diploptera punctata TaxID=6984 RepID=A0AAD7ZRQ9_DIPPU|nr:hypothetical protein L9F63_002699 [Diploptera punctata]
MLKTLMDHYQHLVSQMSGYFPSSFATEDYPDIKYLFAFSDIDTQAFEMPFSYYNQIYINPYVMRPLSKGYLTINSTDPFAAPLIYPRLLTNPKDREILLQGHLKAMEIATTETFQDAGYILDETKYEGCEEEEFGSREYFSCVLTKYVDIAHHFSGTCKMGPSNDKEAVVDPRLRVYGVKYLRVVDASIIPQIPSGNTNAPAIMIGEMASDIIKQDYNKI